MSATSASPQRALSQVASWQLWCLPRRLIAYLLTVECASFALALWLFCNAAFAWDEIILFATLMAGAGLTLSALRRVGTPSAPFSDLQFAWMIPVVLLLPPWYAVVGAVLSCGTQFWLVRRAAAHRWFFTTSVIALASALTSLVVQSLWNASEPNILGHLIEHPVETGLILILAGVSCSAANTLLIMTAVVMSTPEVRWRDVLFDWESRRMESAEVTSGIVVTMIGAIATPLIAVAVPPLLLLQRSLLHDQLMKAARVDSKTGLLNAATWEQEAARELINSQRRRTPSAVMLLDVDRFKTVNDTYGHLFGDQMLRAIATAIENQTRSCDIVGRFGGEEFVLLLPDAGKLRAEVAAERLRAAVGEMVMPYAGGELVRVTTSIGIAIQGMHGTDLTDLIASADAALYRAKDAGRDRVRMSGDA